MSAPKPTCAYCDQTEGLRQLHDGGGYIEPDYVCEDCFTPSDTGPSFDDLPALRTLDYLLTTILAGPAVYAVLAIAEWRLSWMTF